MAHRSRQTPRKALLKDLEDRVDAAEKLAIDDESGGPEAKRRAS